jgi:integrase
MDPEEGPLEPTELHTLTKDIQSAYEQDTLGLEHFSLSLFHIATGRRPSQSANLKCKDLDEGRAVCPDSTSISDDPKAPTETLLLMHVPRSKQRAATFRDEFRSVQWSPEFFAIFRMQQRMVKLEFESLLASQNWALQTQDLLAIQADLPLFPDWKRILASLHALAPVRQDGRHGEALRDLRAVATGAQWHHSGQEITKMLQAAVKAAGSTSRTGESLSINALRLRHTKGTDLAREGLGRDIIAWLLDHSTVESVKVYTDNLPEHAIPANAAMALSPTMRNLAQLFRGQIVDTEADALAGDDPRSSRIHFKGKGTATCGTRKQCGMGSRIPICCYECDHFQPWLEGPHLDVLSGLLTERHQREATLGKDHKVTKAADSTIVAIINVIQKCEVRRQELSDQKYPGDAEVRA